MSYPIPHTEQFTSADFNDPVDVPPLVRAPYRGTEHVIVDKETGAKYPACFVAETTGVLQQDCRGSWRLVSPMDFSEFPYSVKLEEIRVKGQRNIGDFTLPAYAHHHLEIFADGTRIVGPWELRLDKDVFYENILKVDLELKGKIVDVWLWQSLGIYSGWRQDHVFDIRLMGRYWSDVPPPIANVLVDVTDLDTALPISGAEALLLDGSRVVQKVTSNAVGTATFTDIREGDYTLLVRKSKYYKDSSMIHVSAPETYRLVTLTPLPAKEWPWWTLPAVVGGGLLVGLTVIGGVLRRPRFPAYVAPPTYQPPTPPPVIVIRD